MMKINQFKRILGLFVFILMISCIPVYAEETDVNNLCLSDYLLDKYNITTSAGEGGRYIIKSNPIPTSGLDKVEFRVSTVNGEAPNQLFSNLVLKAGGTLEVPGVFTSDGDMEIAFVTNNDPQCPGEVTIAVGVEDFGNAIESTETFNTIPDSGSLIVSETIDCTKNYPANSFEANFCEAKNNAKGEYNFDGKFNNNAKFNGTTPVFKCDAFNSVGKCLNNDNYYINKSYMYGSGTNVTDSITYTYNYAPGKRVQKSGNSCKVKCEEAVTVEYGPPIASKAGLCFEYKVKVTSRVSCNMIEKPEPPKTTINYCTPKPVCTNKRKSYHLTQGGPNEDFDKCIKDCDGGKYTDKCTDKCYKKVYGKNVSNSKNIVVASQLSLKKEDESSLDSCINNAPEFSVSTGGSGRYKGCYYYDGGSVKWKGRAITQDSSRANGLSYSPGRWYGYNTHKNYTKPRFYIIDGEGFYRSNRNGTICSDSCWWSMSGCSADSYLNPNPDKSKDQAYLDYKSNMEIYNKTVESCKAKASCTTSTAEFTISVKYDYNDKTGKNIEQTINFPYTSNDNKKTSDKLNTPGLGKCSDSATETASKSSIMLSYDGCYKCKDANRWYQAEWSFPGTWINNKTAEISYIDKTGTLGWRSEKGKFCMPLNAKDVNTTWWNYYEKNNVSCDGSAKNRIQSTTSDDYKEECESKGSSTSITKVQQSDVKVQDIKYNINATARKFGYFGWNIDISCFYGLNSNPASVSKENTKCTTSDYKPRVRSVDLTNLFPAADGSKLTTPDTVGRTPGFNWSEYATNYKNQGYLSNPSSYITSVQTKGYTVYSDNYLDYEFTLGPSELNKLKTQSKNMTYGEFADGKSEIRQNGVIAYRSTMLRNLGNSKVPDDSVLGCNNISNYKANKCDTEDANNAVVKED